MKILKRPRFFSFAFGIFPVKLKTVVLLTVSNTSFFLSGHCSFICNSYSCAYQVVELKSGGKDITVTKQNRIEYIHLMADYRLNKQVLCVTLPLQSGVHLGPVVQKAISLIQD